jgi:hypothetical protein
MTAVFPSGGFFHQIEVDESRLFMATSSWKPGWGIPDIIDDRSRSLQVMKSQEELKREYKERKKPAGIFQVKNTANGKVLLGSSLNLEGPLNSHKFMLTIGRHRNEALQKEWNEFGADRFVFEILEVVKVKDDPDFNLADELTLLEQIWIEKLQPFGEKGYNKDDRIRQA